MPNLPVSALGYTLLPFFANWVIGFTIAEGSFFYKSNLDACFQLKQRSHPILFSAFCILFNTTRTISTEDNKYSTFSVCSKKDVQSVVNFFSFSGHHPQIGYKATQNANWINQQRSSVRYSKLV
jgi:hypothetical protein